MGKYTYEDYLKLGCNPVGYNKIVDGYVFGRTSLDLLLDKISDLEAKLSESKEEIKVIDEDRQFKAEMWTRFADKCKELKKQLAESEKKYQDAIANFVNLENARAILQLEKVKWIVEDTQYTYGDDNNISRDFLIKNIDNQIKAIKGDK